MSSRAEIIAEARSWRGTPFRHQASVKGEGCDCLGLIRGVWRGVIGREPQALPPYGADWSDLTGDDLLLAAMQRHLSELAISTARPGDVLLFRMATGAPARHCAIISSPHAILHAYWGHAVVETRLVPWWQRRLCGAFAFPGISKD